MKKIFIVILLLTAMFTFGESYEFDGDIWVFSNTVEEDSYIASFWIHDLEHSEWNSIDPDKWGMVKTVLGIGSDSETGEVLLVFIYKTTIEYYVPHFIVAFDEGYDSYLLGGQNSNGDYSDYGEIDDEGYYTSTILINLTKEDVEYLSKDTYFTIIDSNNGYSKIASSLVTNF